MYLVDDFSVGSLYSDIDVEKAPFCHLEHEAHLGAGLHLVEEALLGVCIDLGVSVMICDYFR
jgi:hypothetical protein